MRFEVARARDWFERGLPLIAKLDSALALDIETSGLDPLTDSLRTIQVATPRYTLVVDAHTCPPQMLTPVFTTVPRLIGHNLKFDLKFLVAAGLPWPQLFRFAGLFPALKQPRY